MDNYNKLETIFEITSDSFYETYDKEEYQEIKPLTKRQKAKLYLRSILYKIDFKDDIYEELDNYYYICNKCDKLVYYFQRDQHILSHIEEYPVCCNCFIL